MLCAALAVLLSGCATAGPATDGCAAWRSIYISRADALTDDTAEQILAHNLIGRRLCGWVPTQ